MATTFLETKIPPQPARKLPLPATRAAWRVWLLLGAAFLAAAALFLLLPPRFEVTKLSRMTVRDEAVGVGFVQAKVPISASAKINGVIRKLYVDQGHVVKKGQILAQLENGDYRNQVVQAHSQLEAAQAALSSARAELLAAKARAQANRSVIAKNQAGSHLAEINYHRAKGLYESAVWSKQALDDADAAYVQAQEDLKSAVETQRSLDQGVVAAEAGVAAAEKAVSGAEAALRFQQASLQFTIVTSPVDGYVVSRDLEEGDTVVPGLSIFSLAESKVIWVTSYVDEREIEGLRPGQPAQIVLRSRPHEKIAGVVARVEQQADPVTEELPVDVAFAQAEPGLRLQETAEVYIQKVEHPEAEVLPASAVVSGSQGTSVWLVDHGRLEPRTVSVGIVDKRGYAEILSGLSTSDLVVVHPEAYGHPLAPGKRVRTKLVPGSQAQEW